jgi:hypothetical protein
MTENSAQVLILMVIAAALLYSFWKQVLVLLLLGVLTIFCFGLYSVVAYSMSG